MLKGYSSLKSARKSLLMQLLSLAVCIVAICVIGRFTTQGRFHMDIIVAYDPEIADESDLVVRLEEEGSASADQASTNPEAPAAEGQASTNPEAPAAEEHASIESMRFVDIQEGPLSAKALHLSMRPDKPGNYGMTILDKEGHVLATDAIRVDPFGTAFSWSTGAFTGDEAFMAASIIFYAGLLLISLIHFLKLRSPLSCSYDAILSAGIFLFAFVSLMVNIPVYIRHLYTPAFYPTWQLLADIASGGKHFVLLTWPLIFVFSVLLIISNIELLRHERARIQNILGLLLGLLMIGTVLGYYLLCSRNFQGSHLSYQIVSTVENVLGIVITYGECILLSSMICAFRAVRHVPKRDMDYILILGCGFRKDGSLPPLLQGRVDKAIEFWRRQKKENGKEAILIPSGGQGPNECMAEAEAMHRYIVASGIPEESVIKEDRSRNTFQNMAFSKKIIDSRTQGVRQAKTAYATTNYHVFRSGIWASLAGLKAEGLGSKTKWWYWPNAFVRECIGLLKNALVPELILLILLTIAFGAISYFAL